MQACGLREQHLATSAAVLVDMVHMDRVGDQIVEVEESDVSVLRGVPHRSTHDVFVKQKLEGLQDGGVGVDCDHFGRFDNLYGWVERVSDADMAWHKTTWANERTASTVIEPKILRITHAP